MELTGAPFVGAIIGGLLGAAIIIALICCMCTYYPSINRSFILCCHCRCGKLFHKKPLPFSAQNTKNVFSKPEKSLESVLVIRPALIVHQYERKFGNFTDETVVKLASANTDSNIHKIIAIPGSIPREEEEEHKKKEDEPKVDNKKVDIDNIEQLSTSQQHCESPRLSPLASPLVHQVNKSESESSESESEYEPQPTPKPLVLEIGQENIIEGTPTKISQVEKEEIQVEEPAQESKPSHESPNDVESDPSELELDLDDDTEDDVLDQRRNCTPLFSNKDEEQVEAVTRKEEISRSPSQNSQQSNRSIESFKNYDGLILGVDATPKRNGGYCIVRNMDVCEFYSADTRFLPWRLNNVSRRGNSAEFEMKNLMFALLNWEDLITSLGKLFVYTDNMAIIDKGIGSRQGINVRAFLRHLSKCKGVKIMNNRNHYVNTFKSPKLFNKYILPADHLSRKKINEFYNHIEEHFNVATIREGFYATKVEEQITRWIKNRCGKCGFKLRISNSLRDNIKSRMSTIRFVNAFPHNY